MKKDLTFWYFYLVRLTIVHNADDVYGIEQFITVSDF